MNDELKSMLQGLTTDELAEVASFVADLIDINAESKAAEDDGQPSFQQENADFAQDEEIPFKTDDDE